MCLQKMWKILFPAPPVSVVMPNDTTTDCFDSQSNYDNVDGSNIQQQIHTLPPSSSVLTAS